MKQMANDARRDVICPGDLETTLEFCVGHFLLSAKNAIADRGAFFVALSGGSTPKAIFEKLAGHRQTIDWSQVFVFWSDERCVPPTDADSNYRMAMDHGFSSLPVKKEHLYRMQGELPPEQAADAYEAVLRKNLPDLTFDLCMLGVGEDGHTASLFPETEGLEASDRNAIANYVPEKECWRLTLTFDCINRSRAPVVYALGAGKRQVVTSALREEGNYPVQRIGSESRRALWIVDEKAFNSRAGR